MEKIKQLRTHRDFAYINQVAILSRCLSVLPFSARSSIVDSLNRRHLYSLFIVVPKVVWSGVGSGRFSSKSDSVHVGDLTVSEVHAVGYKLCRNATPLFIGYVFSNCLNIVLAVGASMFTRLEAEAFMDLTTEQLFL